MIQALFQFAFLAFFIGIYLLLRRAATRRGTLNPAADRAFVAIVLIISFVTVLGFFI